MKERKEYICLGQDVCFNGEIYASHVIIEGSITGAVCAKDIVHLKKTAHVRADIYTSKFIAEEGSVFHGELHLDEFPEKDFESVESKLNEKYRGEKQGKMNDGDEAPNDVSKEELLGETIRE